MAYLLKQNLLLPRTEWEHSILYYLFNNTPNNPQDEVVLEKLVKKLIKGKGTNPISNLTHSISKFGKLQDVNSKNSQGETILHQACFRGQLAAISYLLTHGSRIDIQQWYVPALLITQQS